VRAVEVHRVTELTPHMLRVTFGGEDLQGFAIAGPTGHVKLYLPQPDQREIDFVALAAPRGARPPSAPISRTFTPRRFNEATCELDIEFFVHGEGPASSFARNTTPGTVVAISGPSRPYRPDAENFQLLAGDETAFPAIAMILEDAAADSRGLVLLEVGDALDAPTLTAPDGFKIRTVLRDGAGPGGAMVAAITTSELPALAIQAWVAGESRAIRQARAQLIDRGVAVERLTTRGYWREGAAGHPDHDMGED
jgi:NADPH-dependent ferric siderophore reductase